MAIASYKSLSRIVHVCGDQDKERTVMSIISSRDSKILCGDEKYRGVPYGLP